MPLGARKDLVPMHDCCVLLVNYSVGSGSQENAENYNFGKLQQVLTHFLEGNRRGSATAEFTAASWVVHTPSGFWVFKPRRRLIRYKIITVAASSTVPVQKPPVMLGEHLFKQLPYVHTCCMGIQKQQNTFWRADREMKMTIFQDLAITVGA
jgi:hypothetical protein